MHKTIISDTSCFILLDNINKFDLLRKLYGQVITTNEIAKEFRKPLPDWIVIKEPKEKQYQQVLELQLDKGEASAITLALDITNPVLILDDYKARRVAESLGFKITGTLGVIIKAKLEGHISSVKLILEGIKKTNFRFTPQLEQQVLLEARE